MAPSSDGADVVGGKVDGFDLILLNVEMADGMAGLREIRRTERAAKQRRTPILAISGASAMSTKAVQSGADLHLVRPITAASLLTAVADALSRESEDLSAVA